MAWETPLDRLLLQQVHLAEKGEVQPEVIGQLLEDYTEVGPDRPGAAFVVGYAAVTLGLDVELANQGEVARRWSLFGRLRACDRNGNREQIAEIVQDPAALMDLLGDPVVVGNVLPLVVRSLFWSGDLKIAVRAIQFLAAESDPKLQAIVDAAVTDLLVRLETRVDADDRESTASILGRMLGMATFTRLPSDVQARYHQALAERLLAASEWGLTIGAAQQAIDHAGQPSMVASASAVIAALAEMRQHDITTVEPRQ